MRNFTFYI